MTGTDGPDVIVATRSAQISALAGDDVICAAGGQVDAGAGDDSVLISDTGNTNTQDAVLGPGSNRYSSPGNMIDYVTSGVAPTPNTDTIDTGPGGDRVSATLPAGSAPTISGGSVGEGFDTLAVVAAPSDSAAWDAELTTATIRRLGVSMGTFSNWRYYRFDLGSTAALTVRGTTGTDNVALGAGTVDVDLADGNDAVSIDRSASAPQRGRIELGEGDDSLTIDSVDQPIDVDLKRGRLDDLALTGVERSYLAGPEVEYRGSKGADTVYAVGCRVRMKGGPGADVLYYANDDVRPSLPACRNYRFTIFGQNGRDQLEGWTGRDRLIGGRARDEANGKQNVDLCRAEIERQCER